MLENLTLHQIEERLDLLDNMIAYEKNWKNLPVLNQCYQKLIDGLVKRTEAQNDNAGTRATNDQGN